jgi:primary-amine oxidase
MAGGYELLKSGDEVQSLKSNRTTRRVAIGLVTFLALITLSVLRIHSPLSADLGTQDTYATHDGDSVGACVPSAPPAARPPAPINPWASLTIDQTVRVQKWLEEPARGLNLTRQDISKISDNHIFMIEAYYPPKASVLNYFSSLSPSDIPRKFARVTIHHGSAPEPVVKDYLVGPLPIGSTTHMQPLTDIYHLDAIPHNARGFDTRDWTAPEILDKMAAPLMEAYEVTHVSLFLLITNKV